MSPDVCICGDVQGEHSETGECQVDGCLCAAFEPDEDDS